MLHDVDLLQLSLVFQKAFTKQQAAAGRTQLDVRGLNDPNTHGSEKQSKQLKNVGGLLNCASPRLKAD